MMFPRASSSREPKREASPENYESKQLDGNVGHQKTPGQINIYFSVFIKIEKNSFNQQTATDGSAGIFLYVPFNNYQYLRVGQSIL